MKVDDINKIVSIIIVEHMDGTEEKIALSIMWDMDVNITRGKIVSGAKTISDAVFDYFEDALGYGTKTDSDGQ